MRFYRLIGVLNMYIVSACITFNLKKNHQINTRYTHTIVRKIIYGFCMLQVCDDLLVPNVTSAGLDLHFLIFFLIKCAGSMKIRLAYGESENTRVWKFTNASIAALIRSGSRWHAFAVPSDSQRK